MFNQKGIAHIVLILLLLVGIVATVYLAQKTQIFKPKAASQSVQVQIEDWKDGTTDCRTYNEGGQIKTSCPAVRLNIHSPAETGATTDAGSRTILTDLSQMSLVKTAYATDYYWSGMCSSDTSKIYYKFSGAANSSILADCPEGTKCGLVLDGAACVDSSGSPDIGGSGWYCDGNNNIHKDD